MGLLLRRRGIAADSLANHIDRLNPLLRSILKRAAHEYDRHARLRRDSLGALSIPILQWAGAYPASTGVSTFRRKLCRLSTLTQAPNLNEKMERMTDAITSPPQINESIQRYLCTTRRRSKRRLLTHPTLLRPPCGLITCTKKCRGLPRHFLLGALVSASNRHR